MLSFDNNNASTSAQSIVCHYLNKYEKWYWSLIDKYEKRDQLPDQYECHHPIPKEIWPKGWRDSSVIWTVGVTFREHFILHLLLVKSGLSGSCALKRFLDQFGRGRNKTSTATNLKQFWKDFMNARFVPHNKGKTGLPYVTESYKQAVGKGGRGRLNNPSLVCKPWKNNKASNETLEVWGIADYLHFHYQFVPKKKGNNGCWRLAKAVGIPPSTTLSNIVQAFNGKLKSLCPNGGKWDPNEDQDWITSSML
jgi:hypothetical protein